MLRIIMFRKTVTACVFIFGWLVASFSGPEALHLDWKSVSWLAAELGLESKNKAG